TTQHSPFPQPDRVSRDCGFLVKVRLRLHGADDGTLVGPFPAKLHKPAARGRGFQIKHKIVVAPTELAKNSEGLLSLWQLNESGICTIQQARVRLAEKEHAHVKHCGVKPEDNLTCIAHLGVGQRGISKAIHQNSESGTIAHSVSQSWCVSLE